MNFLLTANLRNYITMPIPIKVISIDFLKLEWCFKLLFSTPMVPMGCYRGGLISVYEN